MLQPQSSPEPLNVNERSLMVFCLALIPSAVAMGVVCLFHLGVL